MAESSSGSSSKTGSSALAQLIRDRRHELGMSRQELAEATGVPYSTVAQIETAYRGVSPGRLGVIARALQLDPKNLYDVLASEPRTAAPAATPYESRRAPRPDADAWHANPTYSAIRAAPAPGLAPRPSEVSDIVDHAVELLSGLPMGKRLDALGLVQTKVLARLVQEAVERERGKRTT